MKSEELLAMSRAELDAANLDLRAVAREVNVALTATCLDDRCSHARMAVIPLASAVRRLARAEFAARLGRLT